VHTSERIIETLPHVLFQKRKKEKKKEQLYKDRKLKGDRVVKKSVEAANISASDKNSSWPGGWRRAASLL
jgi:hypothetical protein